MNYVGDCDRAIVRETDRTRVTPHFHIVLPSRAPPGLFLFLVPHPDNDGTNHELNT
jgi:hypothetical protein